jgi:hypothetical protein
MKPETLLRHSGREADRKYNLLILMRYQRIKSRMVIAVIER